MCTTFENYPKKSHFTILREPNFDVFSLLGIFEYSSETFFVIFKHCTCDGKVYLVSLFYVRDLFELFWKSAIILSNKVIRMLSTCVTKIHHLLLISLPYLYVCLIRLQQTYFFSMEKTNRYIHEYTFYFFLVAFTFYYWKEIWFSSGYKLHVFFTTKSRANVYRVQTKWRFDILK